MFSLLASVARRFNNSRRKSSRDTTAQRRRQRYRHKVWTAAEQLEDRTLLSGTSVSTEQPPLYAAGTASTPAPVNVVATGDMNGDGTHDIVVGMGLSTPTDPAQPILVGLSGGDGQPPTFAVVGTPEGAVVDLILTDLDGDSDLDVVTASRGPAANGNSISLDWWENDGSETPTFTRHTIDVQVGASDARIDVGDVNGDTLKDLVGAFSTPDDQTVVSTYLRTPGDVSFEWNETGIHSGQVGDLKLADLDGDEDLDLLVAINQHDEASPANDYQESNSGDLIWYRNRDQAGDPDGFDTGTQIASTDVAIYNSIAPGNLAGDGRIDVVAALEGQWGGEVVLYRDLDPSSDSFAESTVLGAGGYLPPKAVTLADLDGDSDSDVLVGFSSADYGSSLGWYRNNGDDTFEPIHSFGWSSGEINSLAAADFDNDGDVDVVTAGESAGMISSIASLDGEIPPGDLETQRTGEVTVYVQEPIPVFPVQLVSRADPTLPNVTPQGQSWSTSRSISADGRYVVFSSTSDEIVDGDTNFAEDVFLLDRATGTVQRISVAADGTQGDYFSGNASISADGRYIVFDSYASNLVEGDTNNATDVFLFDRTTGVLQRVSVAADGAQANNGSYDAFVSADGRFVVFSSAASNLVAGDDPSSQDIFVVDRQNGTIERANVSSSEVPGNRDAYNGSISADGRFVVFESNASNLAPVDSSLYGDVYLRDRVTGTTQRISRSPVGGDAFGHSGLALISDDGSKVVYQSFAPNIVPGDTNGDNDIFVYSIASGQTTRVSLAPGGSQLDSYAWSPSISSNGCYIVFESAATNIDGSTDIYSDVFLHDTQTGTTTRVSQALNGGDVGNNSFGGSVSNTGDVAFISSADNLIEGDHNTGDYYNTDVFVRSAQTGVTTAVSRRAATIPPPANAGSSDNTEGSTSADGRYVVFTSWASNLVEGDTNGNQDVFVYDRETGAMDRVSLAYDGAEGNSDSYEASISADGRYVVFTSWADNLTEDDTNGCADIFIFDRETRTLERVTAGEIEGNSDSYNATVSDDGRYVAFESWADNLVDGDTNYSLDVFVYDRQEGTIERVSVSSVGAESDSDSRNAVISGDGRFVAFESVGNTLIEGGTDGISNIYVYDRTNDTLERVSVADPNVEPGWDAGAYNASMSGDGRYVAFESYSNTFVAGDTNYAQDIFVYDRQTQTMERVSVTSWGAQTEYDSRNASISDDGRFVAFSSDAHDLAPGDTNDSTDVFVRDRDTGRTLRVSQLDDGPSDIAGISGDGRWVAFTSFGTSDVHLATINAAPEATNHEFTIDQAQGVAYNLDLATSDVDGDELSYSLGEYDTDAGEAFIEGHSFVYLPDQDFAGTVTFTYTVTDEYEATDTATLTVHVTRYQDFGDAPESYGTSLDSPGYEEGGARHGGTHGATDFPRFGQNVDFETDGHPSPNALGDDSDVAAADDEDGIVFLSGVGARTDGQSVTRTVRIDTPAGGKVDAFIDYNGNGRFDTSDDPNLDERVVAWIDNNGDGVLNQGDSVFQGESIELGEGSHLVNIVIPSNRVTFAEGQSSLTTYARFRISSEGNLDPTGFAADGEVQDYRISIQNVTPTAQTPPSMGHAQEAAANEFNLHFPDELEADPNYRPPLPGEAGYVPMSVNGAGAGAGFSQGETDQRVRQAVDHANEVMEDDRDTDENMFVFVVHPVDYVVTDPQGRQVGHVNGQTINEIGDKASFTGDGAVEMLVIRDAAPGDYKITFVGEGGTFRGGASMLTSDGQQVSTFQGQLAAGQQIDLSLDYSAPQVADGTQTLSGETVAAADDAIAVNQAFLNVLDSGDEEVEGELDEDAAQVSVEDPDITAEELSLRRKFDRLVQTATRKTESLGKTLADELKFDFIASTEETGEMVEAFWKGLGQSMMGGIPGQVYHLAEIMGVEVPHLFLPNDAPQPTPAADEAGAAFDPDRPAEVAEAPGAVDAGAILQTVRAAVEASSGAPVATPARIETVAGRTAEATPRSTTRRSASPGGNTVP